MRVCFLCNDVNCFLAILAGSEKNWINARGMSLVLGWAGLIHSQKETVPCGSRVTFSNRQPPPPFLHCPYFTHYKGTQQTSCKLEYGLDFQKEILSAQVFRVMYILTPS